MESRGREAESETGTDKAVMTDGAPPRYRYSTTVPIATQPLSVRAIGQTSV